MSGSGGRSEWQRMQAAQQREADRQAREQARLAKEREKAAQQLYLAGRQRQAENQTAAVDRQIRTLDEILTSILLLRPLTFDHLKVVPRPAAFNPGSLATAQPAPDWSAFAPPEPGGLNRLLGGKARYERQLAEARAQFDTAMAGYQQQESQLQSALSKAKADHDRMVADANSKAASANAVIQSHQAAFTTGQPESVEWFVNHVLTASRYPADFPRQHQLAYRPENRDVVVEFELPPQQVGP